MKVVVVTAIVVAALVSAAPSSYAQQSESPPPPPAAQARERAVPRAERAAPTPPRVESAPAREAQPRRAPAERDTPAAPAAPASDNQPRNDGSRRRAPVDTIPAPAATATTAAAPATVEPAGDRPGAVRQPPTDIRGDVVSPRDRAVTRVGPPPDPDRDHVYGYPDYWSYGRYNHPYPFGGYQVGYSSYSPWGWIPTVFAYSYAYGAGYYSGYHTRGPDNGSVKLKVKQRDAEVYVDGYFAGHVDDFDGAFQSLRLDTGPYRIEVRKPGFDTLVFDVRVQPDRTITLRRHMRPAP